MPLPYRTILRLPPRTDLVALAEREVQTWIERKHKVAPNHRLGFLNGSFFLPGVHVLGDGRTLIVARNDGDGGSRRLLLRLIERNRSGEWRVDLVALDFLEGSQRQDTLIIEATRVDDPDAEGQVDPPGVVKQLLSEVKVLDGATHVTAEPRLMMNADIEETYRAKNPEDVPEDARPRVLPQARPGGRGVNTQGNAEIEPLVETCTGDNA